jgi:hypothetical protein
MVLDDDDGIVMSRWMGHGALLMMMRMIVSCN